MGRPRCIDCTMRLFSTCIITKFLLQELCCHRFLLDFLTLILPFSFAPKMHRAKGRRQETCMCSFLGLRCPLIYQAVLVQKLLKISFRVFRCFQSFESKVLHKIKTCAWQVRPRKGQQYNLSLDKWHTNAPSFDKTSHNASIFIKFSWSLGLD